MSRFAVAQKQSPHKSSSHPVRQSRLTPAANQTHPLLNLQRKIGNQALMRLLEFRNNSNPTAPVAMQPKLAVSEPEDIHEQEADRVAQQVMRMPEPQLQRACECEGGGDCAKCQSDQKQSQAPAQVQPQRVDSSTRGGAAAPASVNQTLTSAGRPLDRATRTFMEPRFGQDFSHVRVHSDAAAARSAHDVNAKAYTVGNNIVFGSGSFAPQTDAGRQLIAHELTHVVQQTGGSGAAIQRQPDAPVKKDPPKKEPPKTEPPKTEPPKDTQPQDYAIILDPSDRFTTHAQAIAPNATIIRAQSLDELTEKLKALKGPIGTLFFVAHMTDEGDILFSSSGVLDFKRAETIADAIKGTVKVESIDFRGCQIAQAPAEMNKIRTALKATKIIGSTCFVVTQIADPIKTADGTEITKPDQLKDSKVKTQFNAGMKKARAQFTEGRDKCIINDSEAGYFQTGGKLIAVWANPGSMADPNAWDKGKSICHSDLKVEKVDPTKKMPVIGEDDCKLLEIKKP